MSILPVYMLTLFLVFLLYDHLITLDREVELFRTSKLTNGSSILYAATRYTAFIYNTVSILALFPAISTKVSFFRRSDFLD